MELKLGYKRTEVGVVPNDWEVKPLRALAERIMVGIASAATHAYRDHGVMMFRNQNIKPDYLDDSDVLFLDEAFEETFKNKRLKSGDLLTARTGYPGTTSVVPPRYDGAQCFTTLITRPRTNVVSSEYLCRYINSDSGKAYFQQNQIGGGQKNVNAGSLKHFLVAYPPCKAEQKAITDALSDADKLVKSLEKLIAKKRQIRLGSMQELLTGKRRLPEFNGAWETKRLDTVASIRSGGTPSTSRSEFWDGNIPWCTPTDITALKGSKYLDRTARTITADGLRSSSAELIPARSILMTSRATIGECAINVIPAATNQGFKNFVGLPGTDIEFLYYLLQTQKQAFIGLCGGSTFLEIGKSQLSRFEIYLPSHLDEQIAIAAVLCDMDAEIVALGTKLKKAKAIRHAMMQRLLTGRIRLV